MSEYPQDLFLRETETGTNLLILHAPNSLLDLQETSNYSKSLPLEQNPSLCLPSSTERGKIELQDDLSALLLRTNHLQRSALLTFLNKTTNQQLYGDYQPNSGGKHYKEGDSTDPSKFIAKYILEQRLDNPNKEITFVFHPDIIFFLTQGQASREQKVLTELDSFSKVLNIKIFIENVVLSSPRYSTNLSWMTDPMQVLSKIRNFNNLGLAVDLKHLERMNWSHEKIQNTLESLMKDYGRRLIIHAREDSNQKYRELQELGYIRAIPWIIEQ
ncbi:hypothetical protein K8R14_04055 [bacterium]|nr:hypothetical protein [bacterium]